MRQDSFKSSRISPYVFSFNNPAGACHKCTGLGVFMKIDERLIIPDDTKTVRQGGIKASGWAMEGSTIASMYMEGLAKKYDFSLDTPIAQLPKDAVHKILYGTDGERITVVRKSEYGSGVYETPFEQKAVHNSSFECILFILHNDKFY